MKEKICKLFKRLIVFTLVCSVVLQFFVPLASAVLLILGQTSYTAPATAGQKTVSVEAGATGWTASSNATSWLTVSKSTSSITVKYTNNTTGSSRTGVITVTLGTNSQTLTVTQNAHTLSVSKTKLFHTAAGGTETVTATSSAGRPSVSVSDSWISYSLSGTAKRPDADADLPNDTSTEIYITTAANGGAARIGYVYVSAGGKSATITVNQSANELSVSPSSLSYGEAGGTKTVTATAASGLSSTVSSRPNWITASVSGNTVALTAGENTTGAYRGGTVVIKNGELTKSVSVSQGSYSLIISPTEKSLAAAKEVFTVSVTTSSGTPTISSDAPGWLSGNYSGSTQSIDDAELPSSETRTAYITCESNGAASTRTGHITFSLGASSATLTVTQTGNTLTVEPTSLSYPAAGGSKTITASSAASLPSSVLSTPNWLSAAKGTNSFTFTAGPNYTGASRSGTIKIQNGELQQSVSVSQTPHTLLLIPAQTNVSAAGDSFTVSARSSGGYPDPSSNAAWIHVEDPGTAKGGVPDAPLADQTYAFTVSCDPNGGGARTGTVTFTVGGQLTATLTVNQAENVLTLSPSSLRFDAGNNASQTVSASATSHKFSTVTEKPEWITITPESGYEFSIRPLNNTGDPRNGEITFQCGAVTETVAVFQKAPLLSLSSTEETISAAENFLDITVSSDVYPVPQASGSWIHVESPGTRNGGSDAPQVIEDRVFTIRCDPNPGAARTGTVKFSIGENLSATLTIHQEENVLTLSPSSLRFDAGHTAYQTVSAGSTSHLICTVEEKPEWIQITPESGYAFDIRALNNTSGGPRSGEVRIRCGEVTETIDVFQKIFMMSLSSTEEEIGAAGGNLTVTATTSFGMTNVIASEACRDWIDIEVEGLAKGGAADLQVESGTTTAHIYCHPNGGTERTGEVYFTFTFDDGSTMQRTLTIHQAENVLTLTPSALSFHPGGGSPQIVTASCTALTFPVELNMDKPLPDWIEKVTPKNDGKFEIQAKENRTTEARSGKIWFKSGEIEASITVTQDKHWLRVMPPVGVCSAEESFLEFKLRSSSKSSYVECSDSWFHCHFDSTVDKLVIKCEKNLTNGPRTGTVTVSLKTETGEIICQQEVTITQKKFELTVSEDSLSFNPAGEVKSMYYTVVPYDPENIPVEITTPSWLKYVQRGTTLTFTAEENNTSEPLHDIVTIRAGNDEIGYEEEEVAVSQLFECTELRFQVYKQYVEDGELKEDLCDKAYATCSTGSIGADATGWINLKYTSGDISIGAEGCKSKTFDENSVWMIGEKIYLPEISGKPILTGVWINSADALHGSVLIEYGKTCKIIPEIELNDNAAPEIYLEQDGETFTLYANQERTKVLSDTFDLTEPISIVVEDATTHERIITRTLNTGLDYFAPDGALEGLSFDLSSGASFTFPEGILAGLQFSVDIPESGVPISGSYEKGKFYICIGLDGDSFDEIRDIAEMMKKSCASNSRPKTPSVKGSVGVSGSISIGGYIEGFYDKSGVPHVASSGLMLSASLGVNYSQQFMIGPVPAFFEAELVGSLDAKLGLNFGSSSVTGSGDIDLGISLRVGIGVGVAEVLSISGGAIGEATVHIGFAGASLHSFLLTLGLKGYVKATLLIFSYQYDFKILEKTWDCLAKSPGSKPEEILQEELQKELVNPDNYQRISIDYLRKGSPFRVRSEADSFVSNAYENAMPQLLTWPDGTKLAIWVGYDAARSGYDALCLFASYYDGSDWCQPFQVENDGTMDASPSAAMIGGRAAVVWQNANASVPNNVTLEGLSAMLDLSLAVFDPESCSFSTTRLTQDQTLDMLPAISGDPAEYEDSEEPELCVAWVSNTDNNWFGNGGHNQVKLLTGRICLPEEPADGGPLFVPNEETPTVVAQGCKNINSLAATWNEAPHVYYCMDTDGNPATANDLALYRDGAAMESNGKPRSGVKALNGRAYWTEGKTLYCGGAPIIENMESDRIEIVDAGGVRAVLFTKNEQLRATVYAVLYDEASSSWGSPVAITDGERGIVSFSAAVEADGLRLLVNELEVNSAKGGDQSYGAARIAFYQLPLVTNLRVTEIAHASEYYASGCEMSVDLTLENSGHKMIDSVLVRVLDDSRTVLDSREYAVNLASGSSMVLPCNYMVGAYRPDQQVRFVVTPADQTDDDLSDNSISTSFSWNDLKLDEGGWGRNTENQAYVFAKLFNEGHQAVQNVTVSLRTGAEDGPVVDTFTVDEIDRGAVQNVYFPVEETEDEVYFLTIEIEDDDVSNNAEFVVVQEELEDFALSVSPATITPGPAEGSSAITLTTSGSVPSFETDADWLSVSLPEPDEGADGTLDQESRTIQAEIHYTGNIQGHPREGHVTFTLGGVSATVTVIQSENYLTFVPDALSFPPEGGTESTDVYPAAGGVQVRLATWPEWIDRPTVSGRTFTIVAQPNNTGAARSGELVFTCEDMTVTVPVTQAAHTLSVSAETLTPGPAEGSSTITLTTSGSVPSFETDADWLSVSLPEPEEGADGTLDQESRTIQAEIHYTGNIQGHPREGHVTFTLGGVSATVTVIQSENYLTFVPDALSFPPEGGTESTDVYPAAGGVQVRLATWPEWIDRPTVSGRTFTIVAQPNNTGAARSGELVFTCEDMTVTVPVTQEAPVMTVSTTYESVAAAENFFDVTVQTSNGRPKVYYDSVWIGVALVGQPDGEAPASELQSYTIRVSCAANGTGAARRGGVKFASGGLETILTIDQAANVLTVSPSSLSFGPAGESKTLTASASSGLACTVSELPDWITAAVSGSTVTLTAEANNTGAARSGQVTIQNGELTKTVSVTQAAHTLSTDASGFLISAGEGLLGVKVTSSAGMPTSSADVDWLTVSPVNSGTSADAAQPEAAQSFDFIIFCEANSSGEDRTGLVTFTAGGKSVTVGVDQARNVLTVNPSELSFAPSGESKTVTASSTSGLSITVTDKPSWITASVRGKTVTLKAAANNTGAARSGQVTIQNGELTKTVSVSQTAFTLSVAPTTITAAAAGGPSYVILTADDVWSVGIYPDVEWLSAEPPAFPDEGVNGEKGQENETIELEICCEPNPEGQTREGHILFTYGGLSASLTVTQEANVLTVEPDALSFAPAGESKTLTASASSGLECTVGDLPDWITAARNGDEFTLTAAANETGAERSATITVSSGSVMQSVSVTQNAHYEPVLDESITVFNYINTETELLLAFSIRNSVAERFDSWYIEVKKIGTDGTLISTKRFGPGQEGEVTEGYVRKASYRDITAKEMGTRYEACFHGFTADGRETYSKTVSNTVRDYILEELLKVENSRQIRTLAADLLNYGAAAQVYFHYDTEHLVNENLSAEAQAAMEEFATTGEAPAELVNTPSGPTIFGSVSVMNRIILSMSVRGMGSADRVQIQVRNHETGALKDTVEAEKRGSIWIAKYAGFEPGDMRTAFDFVALADDVETGTPLTWSVEGYAREARLNEDSTPEELALFNAILHYIDAVVSAGFGR